MDREGLVRRDERLCSDLQHVVHFERDFPRHREMLECRNRKRRVKCVGAELAAEIMGVAHDVDVAAFDDVDSAIVHRLDQLTSDVS